LNKDATLFRYILELHNITEAKQSKGNKSTDTPSESFVASLWVLDTMEYCIYKKRL